MPVLAFLVVALEVTEALLALQLLRRMGRWKDFIAGRRGTTPDGMPVKAYVKPRDWSPIFVL